MSMPPSPPRRTAVAAFTAIHLALLSGASLGQDTSAQPETRPSDPLDTFVERLAGTEAPAGSPTAPGFDPALPAAPSADFLDAPTKEKYLAALARYYEYRTAGYDHRQRVFEWQFLSSRIIFFAVLVLVFCGIYFSAIQFHAGMRRRSKGEPAGDPTVTEFSASLKGLTVKSPVLGVITLVISLAFFYLYLVFVYPIEDIF